ncbi:MAG: alpha/beta hydrolase [Parvularculaceae bacterium]|nr:alpha/beta hydrolase [Parvularculaceae bacterium]
MFPNSAGRYSIGVMKRVVLILAVVIAAVVALILLVRTPDTNREAMIAKYGGPNAQFADGPGGMKVHWRDQGCRDCPPMILIHGSSASLHTWGPLIERLGVEYRIITYDQPGHGLTGPHPMDDYSAAGMMQALNAVAQAAGVERFILGGNSMGGWVAWRYALAYPERVDALLLLDAAGAPPRADEAPPKLPIGFKLARMRALSPILMHVTPRSVVERSVYQTVEVDEIVTPEMVDRYWELLRFPGNRQATAIRNRTDREEAYADRLGDIAAPSLVLWGDKDSLIPVSAADTFAERLPNATKVILTGVGHLPMEEAPDATASAISRFLDDLAPEAEDSLALEPAP